MCYRTPEDPSMDEIMGAVDLVIEIGFFLAVGFLIILAGYFLGFEIGG